MSSEIGLTSTNLSSLALCRCSRRSWASEQGASGPWSVQCETWRGAARLTLIGCRSRWRSWRAAGKLCVNSLSPNRPDWRRLSDRYLNDTNTRTHSTEHSRSLRNSTWLNAFINKLKQAAQRTAFCQNTSILDMLSVKLISRNSTWECLYFSVIELWQW